MSATAGGDVVSTVDTPPPHPRIATEATGPAASTAGTAVTPTGGGCNYLVSNNSNSEGSCFRASIGADRSCAYMEQRSSE